jgi:DNA-binding NtrC family response regulator
MMKQRTLLIADDEPLKVLTLEEHLSNAGYLVKTAVNGDDALAILKTQAIDAVITDVRMPGMDGIRLLEESLKLDPSRPVLVMSGYQEVQDAVRAMKAGAMDYLSKPVSGDEILLRLSRAFADSELAGENLRLRHEVQRLKGETEPVLIGQGLEPLRQGLDKAASTDATVLIVGETGTGKEVCSRYLHHHSARAKGPFVVVPCAALPQSLIESELFGHEKGAFTGALFRRSGYFSNAAGGTLLLDDVDDLPIEIQGRLLHVLQSRSFQRVGGNRQEGTDVRIVAATKKNLSALVKERLFRDDLMYRLSVITLQIPPLRARIVDVPVLADFFLRCALNRLGRKAKTISKPAIDAMLSYAWPGNVRELEHVIESTVIMHTGDEIGVGDLPFTARNASNPLFTLHLEGKTEVALHDALRSFECALLKWAFEKSESNQAHAAKLLGLPRSTFQYQWAHIVEGPTADHHSVK